MANSPQGRPADFKNLSPFTRDQKRGADGSNQITPIIGLVGILASVGVVFFALLLKAS